MAQNSSNRKRPNILITPTPGTGKTNTAASLVVVTELRHINVGDFANEENLTNDWNDTFVCYYINEDLGLIRREAFSTKDFLYPRLESETSNNKLKDNPSIALHGT
uniref:Adenylate kinase isoenzyme 6 n=1 Tax=Solanum tuberosum TaxID=4113 RepID=M1D9R6_SOLTU